MSDEAENVAQPFVIRAADLLAVSVINMVKADMLDARSRAADAALSYARERFGSQDPINDLLAYVATNYRPAK